MFSFGLGDGCDVNLVKNSARAGRGTATIVKDNDPQLNGLVIRALQAAIEPSLKETQYGFNDKLCEEQEVYRNTLISETVLMDAETFANLKFSLKTKQEGTQEALSMEFSKDEFQEVQGEEASNLLKMAAHFEIEKETDPAKQKELSLKYQILCDETAIVGVMKQKDKAAGEMQETTIEFSREKAPEPNNAYGSFGGFGGGSLFGG